MLAMEFADKHFYNDPWCGFSLGTVITMLGCWLTAGKVSKPFPIGNFALHTKTV